MELYICHHGDQVYYYSINQYGHVYDLYPQTMIKASLEGNFYIGVVKEMKNALNAAFVNIGEEYTGFLPYRELSRPIKSGDHILVQATHNSKDSKGAKLSMKFSLEGRYCILVSDKTRLYFSQKISKADKAEIEDFLRDKAYRYGFVIRSGLTGLDRLWQEMERLADRADGLVEKGKYGKGPCLISQNHPLSLLNNRKDISQIYTNSRSAFESSLAYVKDHNLPLEVHFRQADYYIKHDLAKAIRQAGQTKLWLPSGAYLIIEKTEALHVIDVNTGKAKGGGNSAKTMLKVNLEAAREVARQIRLRNLSGIILVDFMDMQAQADQAELTAYLQDLCSQDPVPTKVHGLTKLGIMEITRKKKYESLADWQAREGAGPGGG